MRCTGVVHFSRTYRTTNANRHAGTFSWLTLSSMRTHTREENGPELPIQCTQERSLKKKTKPKLFGPDICGSPNNHFGQNDLIHFGQDDLIPCGASGGCLHGDASFEVEKAHFSKTPREKKGPENRQNEVKWRPPLCRPLKHSMIILNWILAFARPKWTKMVYFGRSRSEEVHFGPFRSVNRTLAIPEIWNNRKGGTASLRSHTCVKRNAVFGARFEGLSVYYLYQKGNLIRIKAGLDTFLIRIQTRTSLSRYPPYDYSKRFRRENIPTRA